MYGYRARIGYTSPPVATEVFPYEFYQIVPKGVTLAISTLAVMQMVEQEIDKSYDISLAVAKELARVDVDLVVLGGVPINVSRGLDKVDELISDTEKEIGVPVTTSITAQVAALHAVGAKNVAIAHPFGDFFHEQSLEYLEFHKFNSAGVLGAGKTVGELSRMPVETAIELARALKSDNPQADTIWYPCPHWTVGAAIEAVEKELGVNVVGANQAITWHGLRRCGVEDKIGGFGRLLRDA